MKQSILILVFLSLIVFSCGKENPLSSDTNVTDDKSNMEQLINSEDKDIQFTPSKWTIIDTLPYTITSPGSYKIKRDLTSPRGQEGIIVENTSHVTINLNGYTLYSIAGTSGVPTGVVVNNSNYVLVYNGNIINFRSGLEFNNASNCRAKGIEYRHGVNEMLLSPPAHFYGVRITDANTIQVSWSDFYEVDCAVEIIGAGSTNCKFLSNTCYGNLNPTTGRPTAIKYSDTLSSPSNNLVRNNLFTNFKYGYNFITKSGYNKTNSNTFEYFLEPGFNNDSSNTFKYNTFTLISP